MFFFGKLKVARSFVRTCDDDDHQGLIVRSFSGTQKSTFFDMTLVIKEHSKK